MKRFSAILLVLIFVLLFGCAKGIPNTEQTNEPNPSGTPYIETDEITLTAETDAVEAAAIPTAASTIAPTDTPDATPESTNAPIGENEPRYCAKDGVYTIAWMSDPQHYSKKFPEYYYAMTTFLRDHSEELNLRYIINTGDLVHNTDLDSEWQVASLAQSYIDEIPNGVLAGNHDILDPIGYKVFCEYFGEKRYADKPWYGGSFENNRGHYDLITAGDTDYIFVYMGFAPTKKAFEWVKATFDAYPDRVGALCLHDYYTKSLTLSEDGKLWHDRVVKCTPNVYMVFCGHKYGSYCIPEEFDDDKDGRKDRTVYQMLFNYQASLHDGGGGYLRLIQIDEAKGTMYHLTYSPVLGDFNRFDDPNNREEYYPFDEKNEEFEQTLPWKIQSGE